MNAHETPKPVSAEERYVCRRVITKGVVVASLHPVIGPVFWDFCDESDCNAPNYYGLTDDATRAHVFSAGARACSYIAEFTYQILARNVDTDYEVVGDPDDEDGLCEKRQTVSWRFKELVQKAQSTVDEFSEWVATTQWVEFQCPPRIEFLRDLNGFVGYQPEWTSDLDEAMTFDKSVLASEDDVDVRSCGQCIPTWKAHDIEEVKNRRQPTINHALEADVAYTHFRLNIHDTSQPNSWVRNEERAFRHAAAAGRIHALQPSALPVSGHIAAFPALLKAFDMAHRLALHLTQKPLSA